MKTTIDLPEDLVREMKVRAARDGRKLRDVAAEIFRRGLETASRPPAKRRRVTLPILPAPPGARPFDLTGEDVHRMEMESETRGHEASVRR